MKPIIILSPAVALSLRGLDAGYEPALVYFRYQKATREFISQVRVQLMVLEGGVSQMGITMSCALEDLKALADYTGGRDDNSGIPANGGEPLTVTHLFHFLLRQIAKTVEYAEALQKQLAEHVSTAPLASRPGRLTVAVIRHGLATTLLGGL